MNASVPRFRGLAFETEEGWKWEVLITMLGSNEDGFTVTTKELFPTKEAAIEDMRTMIKSACDDFQKKSMGEATGTYIDMKTNETLKWDKEKNN